MTPRTLDFAKPLLSILFVIAVWQAAHGFGLTNRNLFPGPWDVATASETGCGSSARTHARPVSGAVGCGDGLGQAVQ